jgi:hypothetical protein
LLSEIDKKKRGLLPYAERPVDPTKLIEAVDWKKFDDSDDDDEDADDASGGYVYHIYHYICILL